MVSCPGYNWKFCPILKAIHSPGDIRTIIEAILFIRNWTRETSVLEDSLAALTASSKEESPNKLACEGFLAYSAPAQARRTYLRAP